MKKLLLSLTLLLSSLVAMAEAKVTVVTDIEKAITDGTVVTLCIGDKYLYGSTAQNTAMGYADAAKSSNNVVNGYKIEKEGDYFLFRCISPDGNYYTHAWAKDSYCYLNSQPTGGVTFNLGKNQDVENGHAWTFENDGSLKNVGSGKYFNGTNMSDNPVAVSVVIIEADPEKGPDPIEIPESLKPFIENKVVFTLKNGDSYVYGPSQQNLAVGTWEQASSSENNANGYVLENDDYYFYLRAVKFDGSNITAWNTNPCWLNNNGGNVVFNMGKDQDTKNGSSWKIAEVSDGKYTIESINQPGKYLAVAENGTSGTLSNEVTEWELYVRSCSRTTTTGKCGTICLPYKFAATGATVYSASIESDYIALTEVAAENIEAGKAYIYKATADAQSFNAIVGNVKEPVESTPLVGVYEETTVPVGSYVMQTIEDKQAFHKVNGELKLAANKAYLTVPSNEASLRIGIEGDATSITSVINDLTSENAQIFDINGRKLQSLQKGINIVNGKKVLVK